MLKADLHVHTEYSRDCLTSPDRIIAACQKRGIGCIAVTDHNEIKGALILQEKAPFKVIVGEEIRTDRGEIIGYFLNRRIEPGLSPARTVAEIKKQGGLVCIPHPFCRLRSSKLDLAALMEIEQEIDIVEAFNSRNLYAADNLRAREYARTRGFPVSAGTDAHWHWEIGRSYIHLPDFSDAESFRAALWSVTAASSGVLRKSGLFAHVCTKTVKTLAKHSTHLQGLRE